MRLNAERISKRQFYHMGGFSNPRLFRKMNRGCWQYFWDRS